MSVTKNDILKARLTRSEGRKTKPYVDTVGKITIGIGWNLTDRGLPDKIIEELFELSLSEATLEAERIPVYSKLNPARKTVLIDMVFNMGLHSVLQFKNTLACLALGQWDAAAENMLRSDWAEQVGNRAIELAEIIKTGVVKGVIDVVD